jgi:integrase/recombinase XerD
MEKLNGPFSDIIPVLIKMKKSTGYKYNNIKDYVELDNFLYEQNITKISQEIYNVAVIREDNPFIKRKRYYALENINIVLESLNIPVIKMGKLKLEKSEKFIARILKKKEIEILFSKIDNISNNLNNNYKELYPVLFRLLYSTGLRISEALSLTKADYTRDYGVLRILNSKNLISRNIVLSNSMKKIFDKYINNIKKDSDLIFEINYLNVRNFFQKIIIELSFEPCRIHDLRHMFAIYSLCNLKKEIDENKALYYLSVFMGHSSIESTVYYLQLTPKHKKEITNKLDKINKYIFKEETDESK